MGFRIPDPPPSFFPGSALSVLSVDGLLAISLMLFSMRNIVKLAAWSDRLLKWSFWGSMAVSCS
jgi:nitric oxide reductase large subunit